MPPIPKNNEGITVSIPAFLCELVDKCCIEHDINRSQFVVRAIKLYLAHILAKKNSFWEKIYHEEIDCK